MRFLLGALILLLLFGALLFHLSNLESTATVSIFGTAYEEVPVGYVALGGIVAGVILIGIYAIAEGARIRLDNRRLTREIHRMTTEINFLRTRPSERPEPDVLEVSRTQPPPPVAPEPPPAPSSAPIYEADQDDWPPDADDDEDAYTGGRAV